MGSGRLCKAGKKVVAEAPYYRELLLGIKMRDRKVWEKEKVCIAISLLDGFSLYILVSREHS
jgi:hypothetical protein